LDKILVDTSAWIEFFRKREPVHGAVRKLIEADRVCCLGLIYAELLQGAKSSAELDTLKEFLYVFDFIPESPGLWERAGELSYQMRRKGRSVSLSDCLIAVSAVAHQSRLFTLDRHFNAIRRYVPLKLYVP